MHRWLVVHPVVNLFCILLLTFYRELRLDEFREPCCACSMYRHGKTVRKRGCYQGTSRGLYVLLSFFFIIRPFFSLQFGAKDKWNNVMRHGFVVLELESLFIGISLVHQES